MNNTFFTLNQQNRIVGYRQGNLDLSEKESTEVLIPAATPKDLFKVLQADGTVLADAETETLRAQASAPPNQPGA